VHVELDAFGARASACLNDSIVFSARAPRCRGARLSVGGLDRGEMKQIASQPSPSAISHRNFEERPSFHFVV
jgi:hypothetical protein